MRNERGYTLAELLTAMAVLALLMAGLFLTLQEGQTVYSFGAGRAEVQQNARVGLERILRELRTACLVITAQPSDVKFTYMDEASTSCTVGAVTVEYNLSGTNLQRIQTAPTATTGTLVGGVTGLAIVYYDVNNATTTTPANVYGVDITLTARSEDTTLAAASPANRQAVVQGRVKLRNE